MRDYSPVGGQISTTGAPPWMAGKFGTTLDFDGTEDYLLTNYTVPITAFTWTLWFKADVIPTAGNYISIISDINGDGTSPYNVWLLTNSSELQFWNSADTSGTIKITGLSSGQWYFIAQSREGNSITNGYKVYKDGVFIQQGNTGGLTVPQQATTIATQDSASGFFRFFNGQIDDVRFYNRVLSASEIWEMYTNPMGIWRSHRLPPSGISTLVPPAGPTIFTGPSHIIRQKARF